MVLSGNVSEQLDIDANRKFVNFNLNANSLQLDKIKSIKQNLIGSLANIDLSVYGKGNNISSLINTANGDVTVELTQGTITNKWFNSTLPNALNLIKEKSNNMSFSTSDQRSELLCGAMHLNIKDGIATSDKRIAVETDTLNFLMSGKINLKNLAIDMTVVPSVNQTRGMANQLLNMAQAIRLTGSLNAPDKMKVDVNVEKGLINLAEIATQKLTGERKTSYSSGLCEKALGRSLTQPKSQVQKVNKQPTNQQQKTSTSTQKQPDLKQQLIQSLSKALAGQVEKKQ